MRSFVFEAYTPERAFYSAEVQAVTLRMADGDITINARHDPVTGAVQIGALHIQETDGVWKTAFISSGLLEVKRSKTVLLVEAAEWPKEIDVERAKLALAAARQELKEGGASFFTRNARKKLHRAEARLKAAGIEG
jgi:F-type H+-transporting ATPase subunit epsilon